MRMSAGAKESRIPACGNDLPQGLSAIKNKNPLKTFVIFT